MTQTATFHQITIVGTGLIGGSFGLAVKKHGFRGTVVGCDRKPVLAKARKLGAIDRAVGDPIAASAGSDLVFLATPVGGIVAHRRRQYKIRSSSCRFASVRS